MFGPKKYVNGKYRWLHNKEVLIKIIKKFHGKTRDPIIIFNKSYFKRMRMVIYRLWESFTHREISISDIVREKQLYYPCHYNEYYVFCTGSLYQLPFIMWKREFWKKVRKYVDIEYCLKCEAYDWRRCGFCFIFVVWCLENALVSYPFFYSSMLLTFATLPIMTFDFLRRIQRDFYICILSC